MGCYENKSKRIIPIFSLITKAQFPGLVEKRRVNSKWLFTSK